MYFSLDNCYGVPSLIRELANYFIGIPQGRVFTATTISEHVSREINILPAILREYLYLSGERRLFNIPFFEIKDGTRYGAEVFSASPIVYDAVNSHSKIPCIPLMLVNGTICYSKECNIGILPHNLKEICSAMILLLEKPYATQDEILEVIKGPDLPSGGILLCEKGLYNNDICKVINKAKINLFFPNEIAVKELPYGVDVNMVIEEIASLTRKGNFEEICDFYNHSKGANIDIRIQIKQGTDVEKTIKNLYKRTSLQKILISDMKIEKCRGTQRTTIKGVCENLIDSLLSSAMTKTMLKEQILKVYNEYGSERKTTIVWK